MKTLRIKSIFILTLISVRTSIGFSQKEHFTLADTSFEVGQIFSDDGEIRFALNKGDVLPYSFPLLDSIASFLLVNDDLTMEIGRHKDSRGKNVTSFLPTERRSKEVANYLIRKGVSKHRLIPRGYGEQRPNTAYWQKDSLLFEKPENDLPFEDVVLTDAYINQFKEENPRLYQRLHQHNRRTEFKILGIKHPREKNYFSLEDSVFQVGQLFKQEIEYRYWTCSSENESSQVLEEEHQGRLDSLMHFVKNHPEIILQIGKHTDSRGSDSSNLKVSSHWARTIRRQLIDQGFPERQIISKGYGELEPMIVFKRGNEYFVNRSSHDEVPIELNQEYINQFKESNQELFKRLHQFNRRTEFKIVEILNEK